MSIKLSIKLENFRVFPSVFFQKVMKLFYLSLIISSIWLSIDGLKVLGVLPFASRSHFAIGSSIMKSLLKAGHEVTVISPYPMKKPLKNYHDVDVSSVIEVFKKSVLSKKV